MKILYVNQKPQFGKELENMYFTHACICMYNELDCPKQKKTMKCGFLVFIKSFYYNNTIQCRLGSSGEDFATVLLACLSCWLGPISWIVYGVSGVPSSCSLNTFFNTTLLSNGFRYILMEIQTSPYCLNKSSW